MIRTRHRLCRRAAEHLRALSAWLGERAERLDAAGSWARPRPLRFETDTEGLLRKIMDAGFERMRERMMADILAPYPNVFAGWDMAQGRDRSVFVRFPSDAELRDEPPPRMVPLVISKEWVIPDA